MDSNTYTRLLELPNKQIHVRPLNRSTTTISRSFTILQSPYFNGPLSPISPSSGGNFYVYVIVDAFTYHVVLHPSPRNDAANALNLFFGIKCIKVITGKFAHFCLICNVQFKSLTPYASWSNGLVENSYRQMNTFLSTVLDSQYDTWPQN